MFSHFLKFVLVKNVYSVGSKSEVMLHAVGENALQTLFHMVFACIEIPRILLIKGKLHWRGKKPYYISSSPGTGTPLVGRPMVLISIYPQNIIFKTLCSKVFLISHENMTKLYDQWIYRSVLSLECYIESIQFFSSLGT